ncbi:MAG: hypothetical protein ACLPUT_07730 [Solirubrobacteraceae bacterium]|jgi:hypothetical protein
MNDQRYAPDALLNEAASLVHLLGGVGSKHLILIGGLVPPLLVPIAASAHVGSSDIDFCLSIALTEGATRDYYKSIEETIEPFFEPTPRNRFRWIKRRDAPGLRILVDFLAPEDPSDSLAVDGARQLDDQTAGTNTGLRLRPFPVRCGELIDLDAVTTTYERVDLLYKPSVSARVHLRHAGPVGFLAAKAEALNGRDDPKDGYDIAWWCLNAAPTAEAVADLLSSRPGWRHSFIPEAIAMLKDNFAERNYPGPSGYATESHPSSEPGDRDFETARNQAFTRVNQVLERLEKRIVWTPDES